MPIDYSRITKKLREGQYSGSPSFAQTVKQDEIQDEPANMDTSSGGIFSSAAKAQEPESLSGSIVKGVAGFAGDVARGIVKPIGQTLVQMPRALVAGAAGLLGDEETQRDFSKPVNVPFLGEVKGLSANPYDVDRYGTASAEQMAGQALEIGSSLVGGEAASSALKSGAKVGIKQLAKQGAKEGLKAGVLAGAGGAMQEDKGVYDVAGSAVLGGAFGSALGAGLGASSPYISKALDKLRSSKGGSLAAAADDAVEAAKRKEAGITEATHWTKQVPEDPKPFEGLLHDIDDDLFPPKAPDSVPMEESLTKRALKNGIKDGRINTIAEMSQAERTDALKALDMADYKEMHELAPHPNLVAAKPIMDQVGHLQKVKSEAGAALDGLVASMPKEPLSLNEPTQVIRSWLDDNGVQILFDQKGNPVLDFESSLFKGGSSAGDRKIIQEVFDELHPPKAKGRIIFRTPEEIRMMRQRLFKLAQDNKKSAQPFSDTLSPLIDNVRESLNEPLAVLSPKYAEMNKRYALAKDGLTKFMKYLGKDFYGKEDEVISGRVAELLPRLISNTGEKPGVILRDLADAALKTGMPKEAIRDPRRMILFTDGLDDLYDLGRPRSFKGEVKRAGEDLIEGGQAAYDVVTGHPVRGGLGIMNMFKGDLRKKQRQLLREMLESTSPLKQESILNQVENMAESAT